MKKESLSVIFVKTLLAVLLFAGMGTIIIGGGYIIGEYNKNKIGNEIAKPVDQKTKNYYDVLEKKCDGDGCCVSSLKTMRENNYKEADKDGRCPEGFYMNMMKCITSYQWCVPVEENCAKAGEFVNPDNLKGKTNYPDVCCEGLKGVNAYKVSENDECEVIIGTPYLTCVPCGNGVCDEIDLWFENKCNCPEDCGNESNTSDWQTYRNEEFGFEVKYPEDFTRQETVSDNNLLYLKRVENGSNIFMNINIKRNYQVNYFEVEEIKIGDRIGYKYFYQEGVGYSGVVLIQLGQDTLELTYDFIGYYKDKKISKESFVENSFDQILSTFKFIEN